MSPLRRWLPPLLLAASACAQAPGEAPYSIPPGLFDESKPDLGLDRAAGAETARIFSPTDGTDRFANGVVLMPFKGRLYAQWQSSPRDEDSPDTWVAYAVSSDGLSWSTPRVLEARGQGGRMHSSGGWWTDGKRLIAYINVWPTGFQSGEGGYTQYRVSRDGERWSAPKRVMGAGREPIEGIIEQDPHLVAGGRIVTAFHMRPGMIVAPHYTDDPAGTRGWRRGRIALLPNDGKVSRELEPSLFSRGACLVMVFRDQASTFRQLAAESCDAGATWTAPALTNMPDSRAKQSAGNLPDGTAFVVNAPRGDRVRMPLAITLSRDGRIFDRAFVLRGETDLQPRRYEGLYKRAGYHYPKSVIWGGHLYVAYATNKEDVELTRIPIARLR